MLDNDREDESNIPILSGYLPWFESKANLCMYPSVFSKLKYRVTGANFCGMSVSGEKEKRKQRLFDDEATAAMYPQVWKMLGYNISETSSDHASDDGVGGEVEQNSIDEEAPEPPSAVKGWSQDDSVQIGKEKPEISRFLLFRPRAFTFGPRATCRQKCLPARGHQGFGP